MEIIIAGVGKVGLTLARQLVAEEHSVTLIDMDSLVLEEAVEQLMANGHIADGFRIIPFQQCKSSCAENQQRQ